MTFFVSRSGKFDDLAAKLILLCAYDSVKFECFHTRNEAFFSILDLEAKLTVRDDVLFSAAGP